MCGKVFQIIQYKIWDSRCEIKVDLRKRRIVLYARRQDSDEGWDVGEKGETEGGALLIGHSHFSSLLFLVDPLQE